MMLVSFIICLLIFLGIGLASAIQHKTTLAHYHLAGKQVKPWLVALSAVATANSGYMFIGMVGYTYAVGLSSVWLLFGWIVGDLLASFFIHKHLCSKTKETGALSFAGVLSSWHGTQYKHLRWVAGLITLVFLGTYAAAQLKAGSKALHVLLGWDLSVGAIIGAIMVLLYSIAGGIRASIWTDAAQSVVMMFAMIMLCFIAVENLGGFSLFVTALSDVSPQYLNLFPKSENLPLFLTPLLFVTGWLFAGFGVAGQPHIMVRFMSMRKPEDMTKVRIYYYSWYIVFSILTIAVGLVARLLISDTTNFDSELALPTLAQHLMPDVLVGLILASLFAATLSTADSQIISCSSALTQDFSKFKTDSYLASKVATLLVTLVALTIALSGSESVFALVLIAWSALASAFTPLITCLALGAKPSERLSLIMVGVGLMSMLVWRLLDLNHWVYEAAPGILGGFMPFVLFKLHKSYVWRKEQRQLRRPNLS